MVMLGSFSVISSISSIRMISFMIRMSQKLSRINVTIDFEIETSVSFKFWLAGHAKLYPIASIVLQAFMDLVHTHADARHGVDGSLFSCLSGPECF